jgi:hypothetical protein
MHKCTSQPLQYNTVAQRQSKLQCKISNTIIRPSSSLVYLSTQLAADALSRGSNMYLASRSYPIGPSSSSRDGQSIHLKQMCTWALVVMFRIVVTHHHVSSKVMEVVCVWKSVMYTVGFELIHRVELERSVEVLREHSCGVQEGRPSSNTATKGPCSSGICVVPA